MSHHRFLKRPFTRQKFLTQNQAKNFVCVKGHFKNRKQTKQNLVSLKCHFKNRFQSTQNLHNSILHFKNRCRTYKNLKKKFTWGRRGGLGGDGGAGLGFFGASLVMRQFLFLRADFFGGCVGYLGGGNVSDSFTRPCIHANARYNNTNKNKDEQHNSYLPPELDTDPLDELLSGFLEGVAWNSWN